MHVLGNTTVLNIVRHMRCFLLLVAAFSVKGPTREYALCRTVTNNDNNTQDRGKKHKKRVIRPFKQYSRRDRLVHCKPDRLASREEGCMQERAGGLIVGNGGRLYRFSFFRLQWVPSTLSCSLSCCVGHQLVLLVVGSRGTF